ncbi:MAG: hypothetical protein AB1773_03720 [Pseudomonadota bacterium]
MALLVGLPLLGPDCHVTEAAAGPCFAFGRDIGAHLYGLLLFAAWGWAITVPAGVTIDFLIRQFLKSERLEARSTQPSRDDPFSGASVGRFCTSCGFQGPMKTWLRNHNQPQFLALFLSALWILPGVIFIYWAWGKFICPHFGKVGKNVAI